MFSFTHWIALSLVCISSPLALAIELEGASEFTDGFQSSSGVPQYPFDTRDGLVITTSTNATIRYKMPGICETTEGVNSYSGYIDVDPNTHIYFWFFESRRDPANDDLTLWLNGGPGSDSLVGLFEEIGPCRVTSNLGTVINPYSWNKVSNLLFISQPVGAGFSYQDIVNGSHSEIFLGFLDETHAESTGAWPTADPRIDSTDAAAPTVWRAVQAFLAGLPKLKGVKAKANAFNLWTQSYGGHYGPTFWKNFRERNEEIKNGEIEGVEMSFNTLGLVNALITGPIQTGMFPEFAVSNTYGIEAYNETIYELAKFSHFRPGGCLEQIQGCILAAADFQGGDTRRISIEASRNPTVASMCASADSICRHNVEYMYKIFGDRGAFDIRHPADDPTPPNYYLDYVNQARIQDALGVSLNLSDTNWDIWAAFQRTGDWGYPNALSDLEDIIEQGDRVVSLYGDADYTCNWFGGLAAAYAVNHTHREQFIAAEWATFNVSKVQYGETKRHGNYSFARLFEAGHAAPFYQPLASLALFERAISGWDLASGRQNVTEGFLSQGSANPTHINSFVALPPSGAAASWTTSIRAKYDGLVDVPVATDLPYRL